MVRTDHLNLMWLNENDLEGRTARWAIKLSAYDFDIEHIKGKLNVVADGISRIVYPSVASALTVLLMRPRGDRIDEELLPSSALRLLHGVPDFRTPRWAKGDEMGCCEQHRDRELLNELDEQDERDAARNESGPDPECPSVGMPEGQRRPCLAVHSVRVGGAPLADWSLFRQYTKVDPYVEPLMKHLADPVGAPVEDKKTRTRNASSSWRTGFSTTKATGRAGYPRFGLIGGCMFPRC